MILLLWLFASQDKLEVTADIFVYDLKKKILIARKNVCIHNNTQTLYCESIKYDLNNHIIKTQGAVTIKDKNGDTYLAEASSISDDFKEALIEKFKLIRKDQGYFSCARAQRKDGYLNIFNQGEFSTCKIDNPLWTIHASIIKQDNNKHMVYYYNAILKFKGLPILYLPYFRHVDGKLKNIYGLLTPQINHSSTFGFILGLPFYYPFNRFQEITITPYLLTKYGGIITKEFKRNLWNGSLYFHTSLAQKFIDLKHDQKNENKTNWHFFMELHREIDEHSQFDLHIKKASNINYLKKFWFIHNKGFLYNEPYISKLNYNKEFNDGFFHFSNYWFQRAQSRDPKIAMPYVRFSKDFPLLSYGNISFTQTLSGFRNSENDFQNAASFISWTNQWIIPQGQIINLYLSQKLFLMNEIEKKSQLQSIPSATFKWQWPLWNKKNWIVEPVFKSSFSRPLENQDKLFLFYSPTEFSDLFYEGIHAQYDYKTKLTYGLSNQVFFQNNTINLFAGFENKKLNNLQWDNRLLINLLLKHNSNFYYQTQSAFEKMMRLQILETGIGYNKNYNNLYLGVISLNSSQYKNTLQIHLNFSKQINDRVRIQGGYIGHLLNDQEGYQNLAYYTSVQYENECFLIDCGLLKNNFRLLKNKSKNQYDFFKDYRILLKVIFKFQKDEKIIYTPRIPITSLTPPQI